MFAIVLGPVFWIMPSPRQKHQMQVREQALTLGLQVKVCDLPQTHRAKVRLEPAVKGILYRLEWRDNIRRDSALNLLVMREGEAEGSVTLEAKEELDGIKQALSESLVSMPDDVLAIEYSALGLAIFWRERGSKEHVLIIKQELERLRAQVV